MPITWKSVSAPQFGASNVLHANAIKGMRGALDKMNIFKTIQQNRSDATDTATLEEQRAFDRIGDELANTGTGLSNQRIKQQLGFDVNAEDRATEQARLSNLKDEFTIENQPAVLEADLLAKASQTGASNARAAQANVATNEARRAQREAAQLRTYEDQLTAAISNLPPGSSPQAVQEIAKSLGSEFDNPSIVSAGYNNVINRLSDPTNFEVRQAKAEAGKLAHSRALDLKAAGSKGENLKLDDIVSTVKGTFGNIGEFDQTSKDRFTNTVNAFAGQLPNKTLRALAAKHIKSDGDFDEDSFALEAKTVAAKEAEKSLKNSLLNAQ